MCFHQVLQELSSVKTQLIYCQLKWRHVSTHESSSGQLLNNVLGTSNMHPKIFFNYIIPKVATTHTEDGHKQDT